MKIVNLTEPLERKAKDGDEVLDKVDKVMVRRLKTGDLLNAIDGAGGKDNPGTLLRHLTSRATRLSLKEVDDLCLEDGMAVMEAVESFLPASLRTGTSALKSSQEASDIPPTSTPGDQSA
jgi:hypothetical protein